MTTVVQLQHLHVPPRHPLLALHLDTMPFFEVRTKHLSFHATFCMSQAPGASSDDDSSSSSSSAAADDLVVID